MVYLSFGWQSCWFMPKALERSQNLEFYSPPRKTWRQLSFSNWESLKLEIFQSGGVPELKVSNLKIWIRKWIFECVQCFRSHFEQLVRRSLFSVCDASGLNVVYLIFEHPKSIASATSVLPRTSWLAICKLKKSQLTSHWEFQTEFSFLGFWMVCSKLGGKLNIRDNDLLVARLAGLLDSLSGRISLSISITHQSPCLRDGRGVALARKFGVCWECLLVVCWGDVWLPR